MSNLLTNNRHDLKLSINLDDYWDFYIHKGSNLCNLNNNSYEECMNSYIDLTDKECLFDNFVKSKDGYIYDESVVRKKYLENIGLCGVDNGIIQFRKDRITNEEFIKLFTKSKLELEDERLKLFEISGNTLQYEYELSYDEEGAKLNGGFFQGFFMTNCDEYKILPDKIEDSWHYEVILKKENFEEISGNTLNKKHPNNTGFFLYIGTRAENKWIFEYDKNFSGYCGSYINTNDKDDYLYEDSYSREYKDYINQLKYIQDEIVHPYVIDGYFTEIKNEEPIRHLSFIYDDYFSLKDYECCNTKKINNGCSCNTPSYATLNDESFCKPLKYNNCSVDGIVKVNSCNNISDECIDYLNYNECCCNKQIKKECSGKGCCKIPLYFFRHDYYEEPYVFFPINKVYDSDNECQINLSGEYFANDAFDLNKESCITDCEYIKEDIDISNFIAETSEGLRINLNEYVIKTDNKFLLFDRTKNGFTTSNWAEGTEAYFTFTKRKFKENLFLLMNRTKTGYTVNNIDEYVNNNSTIYDYRTDLYYNALGFRITEDGRIGYRYLIHNCDTDDVDIVEYYSKPLIKNDVWYRINVKLKRYSNDMRIFIYIDGDLVLCSKYLPILNLRKLNEDDTKQESVPYNISLGGGTQGLCDVIFLNYMNVIDKILPLEKYFGGTFIGHIKSFKFFSCSIEKIFL